jgi:hypothetical protein
VGPSRPEFGAGDTFLRCLSRSIKVRDVRRWRRKNRASPASQSGWRGRCTGRSFCTFPISRGTMTR